MWAQKTDVFATVLRWAHRFLVDGAAGDEGDLRSHVGHARGTAETLYLLKQAAK